MIKTIRDNQRQGYFTVGNILLLLGIGLLSAGCSQQKEPDSTPAAATPASQGTPSAAAPSATNTHTVMYRVTGAGKLDSLRVRNASQKTEVLETGLTFPWTATYNMKDGDSASIMASATWIEKASDGSVSMKPAEVMVEILVDNQVVATKSNRGAGGAVASSLVTIGPSSAPVSNTSGSETENAGPAKETASGNRDEARMQEANDRRRAERNQSIQYQIEQRERELNNIDSQPWDEETKQRSRDILQRDIARLQGQIE